MRTKASFPLTSTLWTGTVWAQIKAGYLASAALKTENRKNYKSVAIFCLHLHSYNLVDIHCFSSRIWVCVYRLENKESLKWDYCYCLNKGSGGFFSSVLGRTDFFLSGLIRDGKICACAIIHRPQKDVHYFALAKNFSLGNIIARHTKNPWKPQTQKQNTNWLLKTKLSF